MSFYNKKETTLFFITFIITNLTRFYPQPDKYKQVSNRLSDRFGEGAGRSIPVRNISLPDLSLPMELQFNDQFSLFVPKHRKMAGKLIDIFMGKLLFYE